MDNMNNPFTMWQFWTAAVVIGGVVNRVQWLVGKERAKTKKWKVLLTVLVGLLGAGVGATPFVPVGNIWNRVFVCFTAGLLSHYAYSGFVKRFKASAEENAPGLPKIGK